MCKQNFIMNGETILRYNGKQSHVVIPEGVTKIDDYAFMSCQDMKHITIPDSVTYIGTNAFQNCTNLYNIRMSKNIHFLGKGAFYGCKNLRSVILPDGISSINEDTFASCCNLVSVKIPNHVQAIANGAFCGCTRLNYVAIPDGLVSIGICTFFKCENLIELIFPDTIQSIGLDAFSSCTRLKYITLHGGHSSDTYRLLQESGLNMERIEILDKEKDYCPSCLPEIIENFEATKTKEISEDNVDVSATKYLFVVTHSFDNDYVSVPCFDRAMARRVMNDYIATELEITMDTANYIPSILCIDQNYGNHYVFVYKKDIKTIEEAKKYDYAEYRIFELAHGIEQHLYGRNLLQEIDAHSFVKKDTEFIQMLLERENQKRIDKYGSCPGCGAITDRTESPYRCRHCGQVLVWTDKNEDENQITTDSTND